MRGRPILERIEDAAGVHLFCGFVRGHEGGRNGTEQNREMRRGLCAIYE